MDEVKEISKRMYEVNENIVRFVTKPGRTILRCSCYNGTMFCNENPWCCHKEIVINWRYEQTKNGTKKRNKTSNS